MINVESKLENTRKHFQELGKTLSDLVNSSPDIFDSPEINSRLKAFRQAYEEAKERLDNPSFCISTIGTTSSGKSTIVNALIGRKIAPIEAGEMSGGVLNLKHSHNCQLAIASTEGAVWETGEWPGLNDDEFYEKIRSVMYRYHEHRKKKDCIAPQITVQVPLLPACDPLLLGLPKGVGIEFIDLPGLKSVQDRTNLAIIQERVNKAFSLVALDYMQVDDEHRKKLLEELKRVVEYLQGRTDSMIFILNRVDNRGSDDLPIEERIVKLQQEIQQVLSLQEPPDILPFSARFLYYAQCAWGSGSLTESSEVEQSKRLKLLKAMFEDCGKIIKFNTNNRDLRNWFRDIEDRVEDDKPVDDETMKQILYYALEWSGGKEFWKRLEVRVQELFSELVLLPALVEVFDNYDSLAAALDVLIQTKQIYNQEQIEEERKKNNQIKQDLLNNIKKISQGFKAEVKQYIEALKTNEFEVEIARTKAGARKGFQAIFDAVNQVEGDLIQVLIDPVRDALKNNIITSELEYQLREVISLSLTHDIARAYDKVSRRLSNFNPESEYLIRCVRTDDEKGIKELEGDERYVRLLYQAMRNSLSARAEFSLQAQVKDFIEALEFLVEEQLAGLKYCLPEIHLSSININISQAIMIDIRKKLGENLPNLPEKLFEVSTDIRQTDDIKNQVVEKEAVTNNREVGSCFNSRMETYTKDKDVMVNVKYKKLILPNIDMMARQWASGVEKGKEGLWDILFNWLISRLDYVNYKFENSVIENTNLVERCLQDRLVIIEKNFKLEIETWREFKNQKNAVLLVRRLLEKEVFEQSSYEYNHEI